MLVELFKNSARAVVEKAGPLSRDEPLPPVEIAVFGVTEGDHMLMQIKVRSHVGKCWNAPLRPK
jgi:hypothetical protein